MELKGLQSCCQPFKEIYYKGYFCSCYAVSSNRVFSWSKTNFFELLFFSIRRCFMSGSISLHAKKSKIAPLADGVRQSSFCKSYYFIPRFSNASWHFSEVFWCNFYFFTSHFIRLFNLILSGYLVPQPYGSKSLSLNYYSDFLHSYCHL